MPCQHVALDHFQSKPDMRFGVHIGDCRRNRPLCPTGVNCRAGNIQGMCLACLHVASPSLFRRGGPVQTKTAPKGGCQIADCQKSIDTSHSPPPGYVARHCHGRRRWDVTVFHGLKVGIPTVRVNAGPVGRKCVPPVRLPDCRSFEPVRRTGPAVGRTPVGRTLNPHTAFQCPLRLTGHTRRASAASSCRECRRQSDCAAFAPCRRRS